MKDYLTIREYAEIKGCSVSAVYKRLKTTLQPYCREVNNTKVLNIKVLQDEGLKPLEVELEDKIEVSTPPSSTSSTSPSSSFLEKQIEEKDLLIARLNSQIDELQNSNKKKDDFIQEQSRKLTELLEQSNILLQNNQILLSDKTTEVKEEVAEVKPRAVVEEETPEKKSWFKRLFG